ncbi:MAG: hypothetical protein GY811_12260 [Myxococcales bacterium]|nr:hypothetical protein [Myxococcales bacterium]
MNRQLNAAAQIAVGVVAALFMHLDEVLEVMGQRAVQGRALGTTWAIDPRARSFRDCLNPDGEDESGTRDLAVKPKRQDSEGPICRPYRSGSHESREPREVLSS